MCKGFASQLIRNLIICIRTSMSFSPFITLVISVNHLELNEKHHHHNCLCQKSGQMLDVFIVLIDESSAGHFSVQFCEICGIGILVPIEILKIYY